MVINQCANKEDLWKNKRDGGTREGCLDGCIHGLSTTVSRVTGFWLTDTDHHWCCGRGLTRSWRRGKKIGIRSQIHLDSRLRKFERRAIITRSSVVDGWILVVIRSWDRRVYPSIVLIIKDIILLTRLPRRLRWHRQRYQTRIEKSEGHSNKGLWNNSCLHFEISNFGLF